MSKLVLLLVVGALAASALAITKKECNKQFGTFNKRDKECDMTTAAEKEACLAVKGSRWNKKKAMCKAAPAKPASKNDTATESSEEERKAACDTDGGVWLQKKGKCGKAKPSKATKAPPATEAKADARAPGNVTESTKPAKPSKAPHTTAANDDTAQAACESGDGKWVKKTQKCKVAKVKPTKATTAGTAAAKLANTTTAGPSAEETACAGNGGTWVQKTQKCKTKAPAKNTTSDAAAKAACREQGGKYSTKKGCVVISASKAPKLGNHTVGGAALAQTSASKQHTGKAATILGAAVIILVAAGMAVRRRRSRMTEGYQQLESAKYAVF